VLGSVLLPVSAFGLGLPATRALRAVVRQHPALAGPPVAPNAKTKTHTGDPYFAYVKLLFTGSFHAACTGRSVENYGANDRSERKDSRVCHGRKRFQQLWQMSSAQRQAGPQGAPERVAGRPLAEGDSGRTGNEANSRAPREGRRRTAAGRPDLYITIRQFIFDKLYSVYLTIFNSCGKDAMSWLW
jgi:hypothetical protein